MLNRSRIIIKHHLEAAKDSLHSLRRQPIATAMTLMVMALALTLPALFWVLTDNISKIANNWQRGGQISLYLAETKSIDAQEKLLAHVREIEGVGQAVLKTPSEGLAELQQQAGLNDLILQLPDNPLPAVIEISPAITVDSLPKMEQLYYQLKILTGVDEAKLDLQWVNRLHALLDFAQKITDGLIILLGVTVVFIIGNTLRLAIQNRHEEVQVLKLIGATNAYIARPFLYTGLWYGVGAALLTLLFVHFFMLSLSIVFSKLVAVYNVNYFIPGLTVTQAILLFLSAVILGWLGARLSIKRQLASIEP